MEPGDVPRPRKLTATQVARLTGYSYSTIQQYSARGSLRHDRTPGGHRRYDEAEVREDLDAMQRPRPALPVTIPVRAWQRIYSSVPGRTGNWALSKALRLSRVPVAGDLISHDGRWASDTVGQVTLCDGGETEVELTPCTTDSPRILDGLAELVEDHGWEQHAGPWKDQGPE